jgi:hypothetical protein
MFNRGGKEFLTRQWLIPQLPTKTAFSHKGQNGVNGNGVERRGKIKITTKMDILGTRSITKMCSRSNYCMSKLMFSLICKILTFI